MIFRKAQVSMYFAFMIIAIVIITVAAVFAPAGVLMNTELYAAGEDIFLQANDSISKISDNDVKSVLYSTFDKALDAEQNNIEVNAAIFQYGWVLVIGLVGLIIFLYTRQLVEYGGGRFV